MRMASRSVAVGRDWEPVGAGPVFDSSSVDSSSFPLESSVVPDIDGVDDLRDEADAFAEGVLPEIAGRAGDSGLTKLSAMGLDGGRRIQTSHQPRLVFAVRSMSFDARRALPSVVRTCECTFRASTRVQEGPLAEPLEMVKPSAPAVPGSGMLGIPLWTVRLSGSYIRS